MYIHVRVATLLAGVRKTYLYRNAASSAPEMGPTQKIQWFVHTPATAEAPKDRAGLTLGAHTRRSVVQRSPQGNTGGGAVNTTLRIGSTLIPAAVPRKGRHVAEEHIHANGKGRQYLRHRCMAHEELPSRLTRLWQRVPRSARTGRWVVSAPRSPSVAQKTMNTRVVVSTVSRPQPAAGWMPDARLLIPPAAACHPFGSICDMHTGEVRSASNQVAPTLHSCSNEQPRTALIRAAPVQAPRHCAMMYSRARITDTLPPQASPMDTAGFRWPPAMQHGCVRRHMGVPIPSACRAASAPEKDAEAYTITKMAKPNDRAMVSSLGSSSAHCPNTAVDHRDHREMHRGLMLQRHCNGVPLHRVLLFLHGLTCAAQEAPWMEGCGANCLCYDPWQPRPIAQLGAIH